MSRWRLEARRTNGEVAWTIPGGQEDSHRETAERMATVRGQMYWRYDLYEGATLKATYKRGVWKEHGEEKP